MKEMTQDYLKSILHYDPETGVFTNRVYRNGKALEGAVAGYDAQHGYRLIQIDGKGYVAHRLAWLYIHGHWPKVHIDHINNIKNDNRFTNLREATRSENQANRAKCKTNTSGFKGVYRNYHRWRAAIQVNKKIIYLGNFKTKEAAHAAYCRAAARYFGEFAHQVRAV